MIEIILISLVLIISLANLITTMVIANLIINLIEKTKEERSVIAPANANPDSGLIDV